MIRIVDFSMSLIGLVISFPILLLVYIIGIFDTGSPLFLQTRVGKNKQPFTLLKFRTMTIETESLASHLAPKSSITNLGKIIRKIKIDELPQLWNVLKGDMSMVGPRPNLFTQKELILERDRLKIYEVLPGITGLAQIQNIDMSTPKLLAKTDAKMINTMSVKNYLKYISRTIIGSGSGDAIGN